MEHIEMPILFVYDLLVSYSEGRIRTKEHPLSGIL